MVTAAVGDSIALTPVERQMFRRDPISIRFPFALKRFRHLPVVFAR